MTAGLEEGMPDLDSLMEYSEIVRKMFGSEEEGFQFYNGYAYEKGFSVRKDYCEWDGGHNERTLRQFVCSCQGFRAEEEVNREDRQRRPRNITRCGCPAKFVIAEDQNRQWYVKDFIDEHNHPMIERGLACFLRSHRKISDAQKAQIVEMQIAGIRKHQIMDVMEMRYADMEQVQRALQEYEQNVMQLKKIQSNMDFKTELERSKAEIAKLEHEHKYQELMSEHHAKLDKSEDKEIAAQMKKVLSDQRALFARLIAQERATAEEALRKTHESYDQILKKEQENIDYYKNEARAQVEQLDNDRTKLKSLFGNLIALIQQQDIRRTFQVPPGMICIPRCYFSIALDNDCRPGLAMQFKVFKLKELYPDLEKYDLRAQLGEFGIRGTSVEYADFDTALTYQGYILDAEVYYLNPAPGSQPPTDLVRIVGQDDFKKMLRDHAEVGTKICLLYLVSTH